jgi:hypothetical protein
MSKVSKQVDVTVRLELVIEEGEEFMEQFMENLDYDFLSRSSDADVYETKIINHQEVKPL